MRDLTAEAAAYYLGVSRQSIWKWRQDGRLQGYFVGDRWRITPAELEAFKRRVTMIRKVENRMTFRQFACKLLRRNRCGLWRLERRLGRKMTPSVLVDVLREEGKKEGRKEMYRELRQQRRLKYPKMSAAARKRYREGRGLSLGQRRG